MKLAFNIRICNLEDRYLHYFPSFPCVLRQRLNSHQTTNFDGNFTHSSFRDSLISIRDKALCHFLVAKFQTFILLQFGVNKKGT